MPRRWTSKQRQRQSERIADYWQKVHLISKVEKMPLEEARGFYKRGLFRGVREDVSQRIADRYEAKRDKIGRLYVDRITPAGKRVRVGPDSVERAIAQSTYQAMVRRLSVHTGWTHSQVRTYLADYPQWREGVSPLYRMIEPLEEEEEEEYD